MDSVFNLLPVMQSSGFGNASRSRVDVGRLTPPLPSTDFGQILAGSLPLIQIPVFVPGLPSVEDACVPVMRHPDQEPSQERGDTPVDPMALDACSNACHARVKSL